MKISRAFWWPLGLVVVIGQICLAGADAAGRNPFFVYNFGRMTESTPAQQIKLLGDLGYDGICVGCEKEAELKALDDYLAATDAKKSSVRIVAAFTFYRFEAKPEQRDRWRTILDRIAGHGIDLWIIFGPAPAGSSDQQVLDALGTIADAAAAKKVNVVLYPHSKCYIASAEAALPFVQRLNRPNLGLAVHLCHEMRAGNGDRIEEVVHKVAPWIRAATLAGTKSKVDWTSAVTMDTSTIMPLDEGDYDLGRFLHALRSVDYRGPIGFINFKIEEAPSDYLARSITKWRALQAAANE